jgi:hypothetical protein
LNPLKFQIRFKNRLTTRPTRQPLFPRGPACQSQSLNATRHSRHYHLCSTSRLGPPSASHASAPGDLEPTTAARPDPSPLNCTPCQPPLLFPLFPLSALAKKSQRSLRCPPLAPFFSVRTNSPLKRLHLILTPLEPLVHLRVSERHRYQ